ncbi:DUF4145 domain-containing protein [Bacteroidota bacterium]
MEVRNSRNRWLVDEFSDREKPNWPCPTCGNGLLHVIEKGVIKDRTSTVKAESEAYLRSSLFYDEYTYAAMMNCSNSNCKESVVVSGNATYKTWRDSDNYQNAELVYGVNYFYPPLRIFKMTKSCPDEIRNQIYLSFSHYFHDLKACANAIRTALELIMNQKKINIAYITRNRKRRKYSLHQRIELFSRQYPDLNNFLFAAKWIGNAGSHNDTVTKNDLLDGYELLEHTIEELYEKHARMKELRLKAKTINKTKKPISKSKKK